MFNTSSKTKLIKGYQTWDGGINTVDTQVGKLHLWKSGTVGGSSECESAELTNLKEGFEFTQEFLMNLATIFGLENGTPFSSDFDKSFISLKVPVPIYGTTTVFDNVVGYQWHYWPSTN